MTNPEIAMVGMGVMGSNLAQNFAEKGYTIAIFNRTQEKTLAVYENAKNSSYGKRIHPVTGDISNLVSKVGKKGIYFVIVKAGSATEAMINALADKLEKDAIIVDLANSYFPDTDNLSEKLSLKGIHFFGCGVSGGEEGARVGPSIMAGGSSLSIYNRRLKKPLEAICAKAEQDKKPCVAYLGKGGAGHFVKMVHNGIEYADMELIAEAYGFMSYFLNMDNKEIAEVFQKWNSGLLESFLIETASTVLNQLDPSGKGHLVDFILDKAMMKGTGTWTIQSSLLLENVVPIPSIYAAVESRAISFRKELRIEISNQLKFPARKFTGERKKVIDDLEKALYLSKISAYAQGFDLMKVVYGEKKFGKLDIAAIAQIWRAGCIIRAKLLENITDAYRKNHDIENLIIAPVFCDAVKKNMLSLSNICSLAGSSNIPFMAFDSSRNYILQLASKKMPANLIQGLRDFFGAHTYQRTDKEGIYHTEWSKQGRPETRY